MKLIDADALRKVYIGEHIFRDGVVLDEEEQIIEAATRPMLAALDAQPVISCETCANDELPMVSQAIRCQGCMCGSLYEPKEQT